MQRKATLLSTPAHLPVNSDVPSGDVPMSAGKNNGGDVRPLTDPTEAPLNTAASVSVHPFLTPVNHRLVDAVSGGKPLRVQSSQITLIVTMSLLHPAGLCSHQVWSQ